LTSQGEPGCFASAAFSGFLHESAEQLLQSEMLELWWLEFDRRPIAAEIALVDGDTVYGYQSGIHPEALAHSPGNLLVTAILHHAIESGRKTYDFLRGDELYKQHWHAEPRQLLRCRVAANRPGSRLRHEVWTAGSTVKSWVKGRLNFAGLH
jgi:CelD/BcsL family acetyltransferase involved in cellulose biosynthesis